MKLILKLIPDCLLPSHPSIKPGQPFFYLGRSMRVTSASRTTIRAHYADGTGTIHEISIPAFTVETCVKVAAIEAAKESEEDPSVADEDDPHFVKLI